MSRYVAESAGENALSRTIILARSSMDGSMSDSVVSAEPVVASEIKTPVVFQCAKCRRVCGDSLALRHQNVEREEISLASAHEIVISKEFFTSDSGADIGRCAYLSQCSFLDSHAHLSSPR